MVVAYRTLMCAQYPSFKQGGYTVAMGQQLSPTSAVLRTTSWVYPRETNRA